MSSAPNGRVLVVEDDDAIAAPLTAGLQDAGFAVDRVSTASAALAADLSAVDVVLLDLGLPDGDGLDVCRSLRDRSDVFVIVVTARDAEIDRVLGLEMGADDYLVKPFGLRELVARIRAVRRRGGRPAAPVSRHGRLELDRRTRTVSVAGRALALTPKEHDILAVLMEDPGAVVSRDEMVAKVLGPDWFGPTKTLDVHVAALRRKLGAADSIVTVRGVGFRLGEDPGP